MDKGKIVGCIFIDLKKAFDSIDHKILLKKLQALGVQNIELKFFENYLNNRTQFVNIDNVSSEVQPVRIGVLQG